MDRTPISITITEEEFAKEVVAPMLADSDVEEVLKTSPAMILFALLITHKLWDKFEEYSKIKQVAEMLKTPKGDK